MSSLDIAARASLRRDNTVLVALLLAFAGGCIDACTGIIVLLRCEVQRREAST
jgi:hypothetical protein